MVRGSGTFSSGSFTVSSTGLSSSSFSSLISTSAPGPVVSISTVFSSGIVPPMVNYDEGRIQDFQ